MTKGQRIKELLDRSGMSRTDFAAKIGASKQTVYKYENDIVTNIPSDMIEKICHVLNVSPGYLMGWEDSPEGTAASGTAASVSSIDPRKNRIDHYYPHLSEKRKDELLKRCEEYLLLDQIESGERDVSLRSFSDSDAEGTA